MLKSIVCSASLALGIALPATALAQDGKAAASPANGCPPGSWFCAEDSQQHAAPAGQPVKGLKPLPDPDAPAPVRDASDASDSSDSSVTYEAAPKAPPPIVVYQPPPPVVVVRPPDAPPPYEYGPPPVRERRREWGLNLHLEGAAFGHGAGNAGMGGIGGGLRFRPTPHFAIEGDLDFLGGHDYSGMRRGEVGGTINGLFFLNPRSRAQLYLLAGFGWSWAHVQTDSDTPSYEADYTYFGGLLGAGLELRLTHCFALNGDLRGFIRGRTDQEAQSKAEFTSDGRSTNTSGGVLFTGGATLYF
jgi:hypothetical protein